MSKELRDIIARRIEVEGGIAFDEYMNLCLGHPEHGYYVTRDPFGKQREKGGDFTTAPEISQLFGEMIGAWLIDAWYKMGSPDPFILCECGPGRGTLMHDILRTAKIDLSFIKAVQIYLVEMSPVLIKAQKQSLEIFESDIKINWCNDINMLPNTAPVFIIGNEFLDALPVKEFMFKAGQWVEQYVGIDKNGSFRMCDNSDDTAHNLFKNYFPSMMFPPKEGERLNISPVQIDFIGEAINIIKKQQGMALFIDYGFNLPMYGSTVQAVMNHQYIDVLSHSGECDITSHVNFAQLGEQVLKNDMTLHGPVSQSDFLKRIGIEVRVQNLTQNASTQQKQDIDSSLIRLIGCDTKNNQMGELFKVMAFTDNPNLNFEGFA